MEATQGSPRHATHAGDEKPPQWRWLAMALAVAVHGPIVLLLSSGETTPFVMEFTAPSVAEVFRLESKGLGELTLTRSVRNAGGA